MARGHQSPSSEEEEDVEMAGNGSSAAEEVEDEDSEELEAIEEAAKPEEVEAEMTQESTEDDEQEERSDEDSGGRDWEEKQMKSPSKAEIARKERERLKELKLRKKEQVEKILSQQNALIDADMNTKAKGRLKFLLQQTEIFAHFAQGAEGTGKGKKQSGRGRHGSKITEEEEDEEYLKEEETGGGSTRLVAQPSCENLEQRIVKILCSYT